MERKKIQSLTLFLSLLVVAAFSLNACEKKPEKTYPSSLHATYKGMETFYIAQDGDPNFSGSDGYFHITGVDYNDLSCKKCHDPQNSTYSPDDPNAIGCNKCHKGNDPSIPVENSTCLPCHSRQSREQALGIADVHATAKPNCTDCHTAKEMHGDGKTYKSMLETGAMETNCAACHTGTNSDGPTVPANHGGHDGKLDCAACHLQTVISCYNCHFDTEVEKDQKKAYATFKDWLFLINDTRTGKVNAATFMSLVYKGGNTFNVFAPFHSHSVMKEGRTCSACHNNDAIKLYTADGKIVVTQFNDASGKVEQKVKGVIPVIDGKMEFDYMDYDSAADKWTFIETGPEHTQYGYCTPLTDAQIAALQLNLGGLRQYILDNNLTGSFPDIPLDDAE